MVMRLSGSVWHSPESLEGSGICTSVGARRSRSVGPTERATVHAMAGRPPPIEHSAARPRAALRPVASAPELPALTVEALWPQAHDSIGSSPTWSNTSPGGPADFDAGSISSPSQAPTSCEGSDDEPDLQCRADPDWAARFRRALEENTNLLAIADDLLKSRMRAPFNQRALLEALVPPGDREADGFCLGLSMEWLAACHARPGHSVHECALRVGDIEQARHALSMQRAYMDEFVSKPTLRRPLNRAFSAMGIGIDRYRLFTCQPLVEPVIDVADRVTRHMSRGGPYHLLSFSTDNASHAIACIERAHGKCCLFDPNLGSFDVDRRMLPDLLASLLVAFARTQAEIESPSDGNGHLDAADVAPHNLRAVCVCPVLIAKPSHGRS